MKLTGSYTILAGQQRVWALLLDPDVLSRAIPGCKELVRAGEDEYQMKMALAIASLSGLFDGRIRVADQNPPSGYRLIVEGSGKIGFVKGDGLIRLAPNGATTEVSYEGDVQAGGVIASVGQRLIGTTAKMLIKRFFDKLAAEAQGPSPPG